MREILSCLFLVAGGVTVCTTSTCLPLNLYPYMYAARLYWYEYVRTEGSGCQSPSASGFHRICIQIRRRAAASSEVFRLIPKLHHIPTPAASHTH
jgi:hypothetical protein